LLRSRGVLTTRAEYSRWPLALATPPGHSLRSRPELHLALLGGTARVAGCFDCGAARAPGGAHEGASGAV